MTGPFRLAHLDWPISTGPSRFAHSHLRPVHPVWWRMRRKRCPSACGRSRRQAGWAGIC